MYLYRYICKFLKECGVLVRVALPAEALGADGLLSVWDQRLASALNAYNSNFASPQVSIHPDTTQQVRARGHGRHQIPRTSCTAEKLLANGAATTLGPCVS